MVQEVIIKVKYIKAVAEKTVIIGCFYTVFCLLMSAFSIPFSILLVGAGVLAILLILLYAYGEAISMCLPTLEEALKMENEEKDSTWRSKMETEDIAKGGK